jgi:WD40 repeat-containing protein SMU1
MHTHTHANAHKRTQINLHAQVVLEMIELRESDTARAMLRQTQVFQRMKLEDPERYMRLEHLCSRMYFDAKEVYQV